MKLHVLSTFQSCAALEEEKKHLEFMNSMKKYDADIIDTDPSQSIMSTSSILSVIFLFTLKNWWPHW
jgi:hypothetical protein